MAPIVPAIEPARFTAGDTVSWTKELRDYLPEDGWSLSYAFRGERGDGRLDITAVGANGIYTATISGASSNLMRPGLWLWAAFATLSGARTQVAQGQVEVKPNLAATNFSTDLRSPAKIAYDNALEAWQSVKLGQTVQLNGRIYTQHNLAQLTAYVDRCKSDYALELQSQNPSADIDPRKVYVRLNRV